MTPFEIGDILFTVEGLTEFLGRAVTTGILVGVLMVVVTLAYGRVGR